MTIPPPASTVPSGAQDPVQTIETHGTTIRYSVGGEGPPLLLCNGIGASLELFAPLIEQFPHRTTVAWDAPGAGDSGVPWRCPSMKVTADIAATILDRVGIGRADVLGVSWGGAAAQEIALRHGDRVRGLVLAATSGGIPSIPGDVRVYRMMLGTRRYTSPSYLREVAPMLYGGDILRNPELLERQAFARLGHAPTTTGYWWQLGAASRFSSLYRFWQLTAPTLVMAGDEDPIVHVANSRLLARVLPNAELEVLEGAGHLFLLTRPEWSARRIDRFLDGLDQT